MRSEVYSWRFSSELKSDLEREARTRRVPVSSILDAAVRDWLKAGRADTDGEEEQRRLHAAAAKYLGAFAGNDPHRSERVREQVRARLRRRHAR